MYSAVLYASATGSCRRYAEMISAALGIPAVTKEQMPKVYGEKILYVGWLCAGKIKGYKRASERYNIGAVVQVGMSPVTTESEALGRKKNSVPADVPLFCLQGGLDMKKLPPVYRWIMKPVTKSIAKSLAAKTELSEQEKATLEMAQTGYGEPAEWCVDDIVAWCKAH